MYCLKHGFKSVPFYLFCYISVALVESNSRPAGHQLVNTYMTNRNADPMDIVELAKQVQKVKPKKENP